MSCRLLDVYCMTRHAELLRLRVKCRATPSGSKPGTPNRKHPVRARLISERRYFLDPEMEANVPFVGDAAALSFGFSFFGFLASRLPRCSPLAMSVSLPRGLDCSIS
jgi:hypothetical protein